MAHLISRRGLLLGGLTVAGSAALPAALARSSFGAAVSTPVSASALPWSAARDIVAATKLPSFPAAIFNAGAFGAKNDGLTDNTAAFNKAIMACHAAGGGTVVIAPGTYVTGAIRLKSNVNLHINGARLMFSGDATKFPTVLTRYEGIECMNHSPMIYAFGETNIALTGSGILDTSHTASWNVGADRSVLENWVAQGRPPSERVVPGSGTALRVAVVEPYRCDRVLIQGVVVRTPMFWQLHPTLCTNVTVDGVSTDKNPSHLSTDGCDPECCDHVVIKNCHLGSNDDQIAIKSGRDVDGRRVNVPSQNIVIFGNTMDGKWGAIACGSELTGGVQNVYAYKNKVIGASNYGIFIKSNTQRGGFARNINIDNLSGTMGLQFAKVTMTQFNQTGSFPPEFRNITITNSSCTRTPQVFAVRGLSTDHVHGFTVRDCNFQGVTNPKDVFEFVDGRRFSNVKINGKVVTS